MGLSSTRTHTTLFDADTVNEEVGGAYQKLEESFESRREYMSPDAVRACETRLDILRGAWRVLLDPAY